MIPVLPRIGQGKILYVMDSNKAHVPIATRLGECPVGTRNDGIRGLQHQIIHSVDSSFVDLRLMVAMNMNNVGIGGCGVQEDFLGGCATVRGACPLWSPRSSQGRCHG